MTAPIGWFLLLLANAPTIASLLLPKGTAIGRFFYAGWLLITIAIAIPYFGKSKLLPASIIRVTDEESFVRKYGVELSLFIAAVSAVLTIIGWFITTK